MFIKTHFYTVTGDSNKGNNTKKTFKLHLSLLFESQLGH